MFLGFSIASNIAVLVISLKTILLVLSALSPKVFERCQAIASPSRSSSLASQTVFIFFANDFNSLTTFFLSEETMYLGEKSPSTLTPNSLEGRSAI